MKTIILLFLIFVSQLAVASGLETIVEDSCTYTISMNSRTFEALRSSDNALVSKTLDELFVTAKKFYFSAARKYTKVPGAFDPNADEVAQKALLQVYKAITKKDGTTPFGDVEAYLRRAVINEILSRIRDKLALRKIQEVQLIEDHKSIPSVNTHQFEDSDPKDLKYDPKTFWAAFKKLKPIEQEILDLELDDLTTNEMATRLKIEPGTVRSRLSCELARSSAQVLSL